MNSIMEAVGSGTGHGNRQSVAYNARKIDTNEDGANWGEAAGRSMYSVFANHSDNRMAKRSLIHSRLWHGVPQLTVEQMNMFEAAYTGHTFIFITEMPKFMTTGIYKDTNLHYQAKNLKAIIERASTGFSGASEISVNTDDVTDGNGRKISFALGVTKEQNDVSLTLHEFAGQPVKNALESWVTGVFDYRSEHGHYFGNLGIPGGWCLANHSMSMLVVQVDPSWQVIQDATFYFNMFPTSVPFDHFDWQKGEHSIIDNLNITFKANEERSPMVMYAAERFMNNRILSMVATSVYNSRQFVVSDFIDNNEPLDYTGFKNNLNKSVSPIIDERQYNIEIAGASDMKTEDIYSAQSAVAQYVNLDDDKKSSIDVTRNASLPKYHRNDYAEFNETYAPNKFADRNS